MKDWKIRQEMYHRVCEDYGDDLNEVKITHRTDRLLEDIRDYIDKPPEETGWVYPAKSYVVALCYAKWLSEDFDEDFYEALDDTDLLFNNDPHFAIYSEDKTTYDEVIKIFGEKLPNTGVIPHIRGYYEEEFFIGQI